MILEANQQFIELMGYSNPQEVVGKVRTSDLHVNISDRPFERDRICCDVLAGEMRQYPAFVQQLFPSDRF